MWLGYLEADTEVPEGSTEPSGKRVIFESGKICFWLLWIMSYILKPRCDDRQDDIRLTLD